MAEAGKGQVDDLATLATLDEKNLQEELRIRYNRDIIYTYIGDILLAVNPYKPLPIYTSDFLWRYTDVKVKSQLAPHVYAVSDACYHSLRRTGNNQCCVVSGESGAGKTESTKLFIEHVAALCKDKQGNLHERIIQVNPLLEAFGNAKTVINDNSSRFGKYIELVFTHDGSLVGAHLSEYLMEKTRVINHGPGERNFHVFYYMFAGLTPEQLSSNLLSSIDNHRVLRTIEGGPVFGSVAELGYCAEMFKNLLQLLELVGFVTEEVETIFALLAAILHITDLQFQFDKDTDGVFIPDEQMLEMASQMLCLRPEQLAEALICNVTNLRGERIVMLKNLEQANDGRDALAKSIYGRLFGWIVRQINFMLKPFQRTEVLPCIGILDMAGFENFKHNSFEQLCINAANEQLQFYFNQQVFQWEMDEYKREGIKGKDIKFSDNRPLIDLFLETPLGIFSLLDEESRFPQGSDASLLDKLHKNLGKRAHFKRPKGHIHMTFTVEHYAGPVTYNVNGFLEKNRDAMNFNLVECMKSSDSPIVCDLFTAMLSETGSLQFNPNAPKRSRKSLLLCKAPDLSRIKNRSLSKKAGKQLKENAKVNNQAIYENTFRTQGGQFRNSLTDLMAKLLDAEPHFIRCIKPNNMKKPNVYENELVLMQLRYTGVMETVKIRRQGYATRLPFAAFLARFKIIGFTVLNVVEPTGPNCTKILKKVGLKDYEIGKTKLFLRYWHMEALNLYMDKIGWKVVHCQRFWRGFLARKNLSRRRAYAEQRAAHVAQFCDTMTDLGQKVTTSMTELTKQDMERHEEKKRQLEHDPIRRVALQQNREPMYVPTPLLIGEQLSKAKDKLKSPKSPQPKSPQSPTNPTWTDPNGPSLQLGSGPGRPTSPLGVPAPAGRGQHGDQASRDLATIEPPKPGHHRVTNRTPDPESVYITESLKAPSKARYEYDDISHYARQGPNADQQDFFRRHLDESLQKFRGVEPEIWGKLLYFERNKLVEKLYLRETHIVVNGTTEPYDGFTVGLGHCHTTERDKEVRRIRNHIGKGIRLSIGDDDSIYVTRLTKNEVLLKGCENAADFCFSPDILELEGHLERDQPMKVFDMAEFRKQIKIEYRKRSPDEKRLQKLSVVSMALVKNTPDIFTPCWLVLLNFRAIDMLTSKDVLRDLMSQLNVSRSEEPRLWGEWGKSTPARRLDGAVVRKSMIQAAPPANNNNNIGTIAGARGRNAFSPKFARAGSPSYAESVVYMDVGGLESGYNSVNDGYRWSH